MKRYLSLALSMFVALSLSACVGGEEPGVMGLTQESGEQVDTQEEIIFEGKNATVIYNGCSEALGVTGCFYVNLMIENTGDVEQVYLLKDVYVDDVACNTGTGLPIVSAAWKKTDGPFIIFCESALEDIEKVEFKVSVMDNETFKEIESSETIEVNLG